MANNQRLQTNSHITEDWYGGYKLELNITSESQVDNWTLDFELPYNISAAYGVDLVRNSNGSYRITGQDGWSSLDKGQSITPIFIIEDNGGEALSLQFANSTNNTRSDTKNLLINDNVISESKKNEVVEIENDSETSSDFAGIQTNSNITEDWYGGYKLELNLTAKSSANNWTLDFDLPYKVSAAYGVDLVVNGNDSYTITGQNGWSNLDKGQSITPIFIIEDNGGKALPLQFTNSTNNTQSDAKNLSISDNITPTIEEKNITPKSENKVSENKVVEIENDSKIISVDNDFGGNLESAIAAANDGEVVQLGNKTYYTSGIRINKDITINGQDGSIVNGRGTSNAIFSLTSGASGATIQNLEITNGNNGIYGYSASNVTLQNLEVHNIGKSQVIREGQNNTGILFGHATGLKILDSNVHNIGRKGVSVGDTNGATISGLTVQNVNLKAQHSQSHDAAGIKFFNTNNIILKDSYFANINANNIWNDTTNRTTIQNNVIENVGSDFLKPSFNKNVNISGIYNEKSSNSIVKNNYSSAVSDFSAYSATTFTSETMKMENNDFSSLRLGTRDYWVNESAEKLIAITEDPSQADFSLFADEYYAQLNIG